MGRRIARRRGGDVGVPVLDGAARAQAPVAGDFQKVTLDDNTQNPMELDVAKDGRVFYIERDGRLQIWKPNTQQTVHGGHGPGHAQPGERPARPAARARLRHQQLGLPLLLAAAGQHAHAGRSRASRSTATRSTWPPSRRSSRSSTRRAECCHSSGSLYFGPDGSLYISTGDNTNPFDSDGFNPIDERPAATFWDAQRTSANTNDLNGKILRIKPLDEPDRHARRRHDATRSRPATSSTRPQDTDQQDPARDLRAWASATRSGSRSTRRRAGC